jgi:hypothetical protein
MHLNKLRAILNGSSTEPSEEWQGVIRGVCNSAVVLFAVIDTKDGEGLELAGTGTFVAIEGSHYILTAAHVWWEVLKPACKLGISIRIGKDLPHKFLIGIETIEAVGMPRLGDWGEWGPDMILLRIPPIQVGTIEAFRVFYNLSAKRKVLKATDHLETWMLIGTPRALGAFSKTEAHVKPRAFQATTAELQSRDGFDYIDVEVHWPARDVPVNFGGVSGGGLWKVQLFTEPATGRLDYVATLEGVAFYDLGSTGEFGGIRCHGPTSIKAISSMNYIHQS